ncbi:MAG TPA: FecR family protein [Vicinamibacterales bacterium]|jgi:ferric-dicitrate binding protein FerR (iron transport regulator)
MTDEEDVTARLLRLAGGRSDPSPERIARVRQLVYREWRATRRRRMIRYAAAAAVVLLSVGALVAMAVFRNAPRPTLQSPQERVVVAIGERVQGQPVLTRRQEGDGRQLLTASMAVSTDDVIETDDVSRTSLRASDESSVRIDRASRLRFVGPHTIELITGAVYIATADASQGFEVRTTIGAIRDVGTQFEVRLSESTLRLRVRTGTVQIVRGTNVTAAAAGTEATVTQTAVDLRPGSSDGSEWSWTREIAPAFPIEGRPLHAFLEHLAAEEGWTLRYVDPSVAEAAAHIVLHGSVDELRPEDALGVALATSGLQYRLQGRELFVSRPPGAR